MNFASFTKRHSAIGGFCAAAMIAALTGATEIQAQEARAPEGSIEITVGTGAGGTPDIVMREVAKTLSATGLVDLPIIVQNRTGGSWTVASNWVVERPGDENTLLAVAGPIFSTPIRQGLPTVYDKVTPIAQFVTGDVVIGVHPDSPIGSLDDLMADAAKRERGVKVAGAQVGAVDHIVTSMMEEAGKVKFNYIPFDGGGAALTAFLGGNSDVIVTSVEEAASLEDSGKLKILALLSEERRTDAAFADIPTAREQGYDIIWKQEWGIAGPPDLDPAVVQWWDDKLHAMVQTDEWKEIAERNWWRVEYHDHEQTKSWMIQHNDKFRSILAGLGLVEGE